MSKLTFMLNRNCKYLCLGLVGTYMRPRRSITKDRVLLCMPITMHSATTDLQLQYRPQSLASQQEKERAREPSKLYLY